MKSRSVSGASLWRAASGVIRDLGRDARHGARLHFKSPGFTLVAAVALAVGIGANLAVFGFVNALLLRPLPVLEPERLIRADLGGPNFVENEVAYDDYEEYRDRNQTLSALGLFRPGGILPVVARKRPPEPMHVMPVTGNYFDALGIGPAIGRLFGANDDRRNSGAVVLSHEGWTRHFGGDPGIVGDTLLISGVPFDVVGVTSPSFTGTVPPLVPRIYATWNAFPFSAPDAPRGFMIGRLDDGSTVDAARADFARMAAQLRTERNRPVSVAVYPGTASMPGTQRVFSVFATLFMVIVAAVLWVACSNVAILQLVRSAARRHEMAVRLALGATRMQLVRQLLVENLLLAALAGTIGAGVAFIASRWITQIELPVPMPIALKFDMDWRVSAFAVIAALAATMLSALAAALDTRTISSASALRDAGYGARTFTHKSLVVTQVALSTVLLITASAMTRSLIQRPAVGLDPSGVLIATISLPRAQYSAGEPSEFFERLLARAESTRGVAAANVVETIPVANNRPFTTAELGTDVRATPDGAPTPSVRVLVNHVSRGHFQTVGIPLTRGRDFGAQDDRRAPPVAIVNEVLAGRVWPGQSALGERLRLGNEWVTVIGVARNSKYESTTEPSKPFVYRPLAQDTSGAFDGTLLVKTDRETDRAIPLIRAMVADLDPNLVVYNLNTLEDRLALGLLPNRAVAITAGILGLVALALGILGTYSVTAFLVVQRRREIGIRLALGAIPSRIIRMIGGQGARWIGAGLLIGVVGGVAALGLLQRFIVGVSARDSISVLTVLLLLAVTGFLATYLPARAAGKADPSIVLRQ